MNNVLRYNYIFRKNNDNKSSCLFPPRNEKIWRRVVACRVHQPVREDVPREAGRARGGAAAPDPGPAEAEGHVRASVPIAGIALRQATGLAGEEDRIERDAAADRRRPATRGAREAHIAATQEGTLGKGTRNRRAADPGFARVGDGRAAA